MKPAIIVPVIAQLVEERRPMVQALRDADALQCAYEKKAVESREIAKARRLELGLALLKDRERLPRRGTKENGWRAYLEAIEVDEATAWRYMKEAAQATGATFQEPDLKHKEPDTTPTPDPRDEDAPPERAVERDHDGALQLTPLGDSDPEAEDVEVDRDTWCTPPWVADAIGDFDLDPCSNERSVIRAAREFRLEERSEDGLFFASKVDADTRVFINPPYSDVEPWIEAYAHTRFCFLLKLDTSTKWFERLFGLSESILLPRRKRIAFIPPPGVPPEKAKAQQFPHALFYARASDAAKAIRDLCFSPWRTK